MQTFTFIGVTTGQSAATRLFPAWAAELELGDVRLVGYDLPLHAARERYREVIRQIKNGSNERGGLITTHKIDVFEACRDMFDAVDPYAELCGETSCLAKRDGRLWALATDPISSERALAEFSHITVVGRTQARLEAMQAIHAKIGPKTPVRYIENGDPRINDRLIAELPPGSLVINATGMGKDTPGSPITDAAMFPEDGFVWDLNYRGELEFLRQAEQQRAGRNLRVEDGWRYFIHGWAVVMEHVFEIAIDSEKVARISAVSEPERPKRALS
ncbi:MAG: shikimate dehydrogenase [Chloroflexi bacterium]|nr:MAG: shikimate dehydrogenase [Chloroflexota bacterium]